MRLELNQIEDEYVRENFEKLSDFIQDDGLLRGQWKFFERTFSGAVTNARIPHNLGFQPKDILVTSTTGAGTATFNYTLFTRDFLDITTSGACTVRFFAGSYKDEVI